MAKRLNPHRRLLARQAMLRHELAVYGNAADAGKLQEGRVRSALAPRVQTTAGRSMRPVPWETSGKPGKVINGRFVAKPVHVKPRFGTKL